MAAIKLSLYHIITINQLTIIYFPFIGPGSGVFLPLTCVDGEVLPDLLSLTCFGSELFLTVVFVFLSVAIIRKSLSIDLQMNQLAH